MNALPPLPSLLGLEVKPHGSLSFVSAKYTGVHQIKVRIIIFFGLAGHLAMNFLTIAGESTNRSCIKQSLIAYIF